MSEWQKKPFDYTTIREQAQWELDIEIFEQEVEKEKERIRAKRSWFPWRIHISNINEAKNG